MYRGTLEYNAHARFELINIIARGGVLLEYA